MYYKKWPISQGTGSVVVEVLIGGGGSSANRWGWGVKKDYGEEQDKQL